MAQDFDKGLAAYGAGQYAAALKDWKTLAEAGSVAAQNNLGFLHDNGQGIPQDYREAANGKIIKANTPINKRITISFFDLLDCLE